MKPYEMLSNAELQSEYDKLNAKYKEVCNQNLSLNMARGKPSPEQLDLSMPMLDVITTKQDCISNDGFDCRNYGVLEGIYEARQLMSYLLDDSLENVIVFGNASLTIMYDTLTRLMMFGIDGNEAWCKLDKVKWLCPAPGYDRHFAICEALGIEMINVSMTNDGPDMDEVEQLAKEDSSIKGIWCVPKYSNPTGIIYSNEVVKRLSSMTCAANDFRIFWDNAYCVHHLEDNPAKHKSVLDIVSTCKSAGNDNRAFKFASTSKITFPGAGISAIASSPSNIAWTKKHMSNQIISHDKLNQLRHVAFLQNAEGIKSHMAKHAEILRPKFKLVDNKLSSGLESINECSWTHPKGGYFISFDTPAGCAKRTVELCKKAGVVLTSAGATYPYGKDPKDRNIRIAPSMPSLDELDKAIDILCLCAKLSYIEKLLS